MTSSACNHFIVLFALITFAPIAHAQADWAASVTFPNSEKTIRLFNGHDLSGWEGQTGKYWSVDGNMIRAANDGELPASTYLFTKKNYRNFRLLFEVKQTRGEKFSTT